MTDEQLNTAQSAADTIENLNTELGKHGMGIFIQQPLTSGYVLIPLSNAGGLLTIAAASVAQEQPNLPPWLRNAINPPAPIEG